MVVKRKLKEIDNARHAEGGTKLRVSGMDKENAITALQRVTQTLDILTQRWRDAEKRYKETESDADKKIMEILGYQIATTQKAQKEEHEKIKEYGESIKEETRNKDK